MSVVIAVRMFRDGGGGLGARLYARMLVRSSDCPLQVSREMSSGRLLCFGATGLESQG